MFERKYNPVTAPVPGVDEQQRENELKNYSASGDPLPKETVKKERVIFKKFGIKIVNK